MIWVSCKPGPCYVWPISPGVQVGRCGICGTTEYELAEEPADGKAHPLDSTPFKAET